MSWTPRGSSSRREVGVTKGAEYRLAFHLRRAADAGKGQIVPTLEAADGTTVAAVQPGSPMSVSGQPDGWQKFEATLRATSTEPKARLALTFTSPVVRSAELQLSGLPYVARSFSSANGAQSPARPT